MPATGSDWMARLRWLPGFFEEWRAYQRGAAEISYRVGTYESFLDTMLQRLGRQAIPEGEHAGTRPFERFHLEEKGWLVGLIEAWASVGEVLSFYQERIANEGYLATAREDQSIRELVRLIDYQRFPGVGSSSYLAYNLFGIQDMPERVTVPVGTAMSSIPVKNELPQSWESLEEIVARPGWNELRPRAPDLDVAPTIAGSATSLRLLGIEEGLEPGAPILILADSEAGPSHWLRRLTEVEPLEGEGGATASTRLVWQGALAPDLPEQRYEDVRVLELEKRFDLFGAGAPVWNDLDDEVKLQFAPVQGGVVVAGGGGQPWESINLGLPPEPVTALVAGPDGSLYAGSSGGIWRTVDGETWSRSGADLVGVKIETLATDGQTQVFAGTAKNGALRSSDGEEWEVMNGESRQASVLPLPRPSLPISGRLPDSPVRVLLPVSGRLYAGTDHGVYVFEPVADRWRAVNRGLPGFSPKTGRSAVVVHALVSGAATGELFAGTDQGVFRSTKHGRRWQACNQGLPGFDPETGECTATVLALLLEIDRRARATFLFAGTDQGVYRSLDQGESWEPASGGLPDTDLDTGLSATEVRALVIASDPLILESRLYAATPAGLFGSSDLGIYWSRLAGELVARPVSALALSAAGGPVLGVPQGGFDVDRWPRFHLRHGQVDLSVLTAEVAEGDWLALRRVDDDGEERVEVFRASSVAPAQRTDFTLSAQVTRIIPEGPLSVPESWDLRRSRVLAGARRLELLAGRLPVIEPLPRELVTLAAEPGTVEAFDARRKVIVAGRLMRMCFVAPFPRGTGSSETQVVETDEGKRVEVAPGVELRVLAHEPLPGARARLRVGIPGGEVGEVEAKASSFEWRGAREQDVEFAETVTAAWLDPGAEPQARLQLSPRLERCYDPRTVKIHANVAEGSQGTTVRMDVLGSGDSTRGHQRFKLKVLPLTYLRAPTARGYSSTLEIRVNGVVWREVDSLHAAAPGDRVYVVRPDAEGAPAVIFGDGVYGSRLPTGQENVVATYRSGMWADGLESNKLQILQATTLGLQGVTNPLPVAGCQAPETVDETRWRAPLSLRTLERIVSLQDYEDFCLTYAGIAKAKGTALDTGGGRLLQVTVATTDGEPMAAGGDLHRELMSAIEAARSGPAATSIDSCRRVPFELAAEIVYDPDRRPGEIERRVRRRLAATYTHEHSRFGARVTASKLLELIGGVAGVESVSLKRLHRSDSESALEAYLEAAPVRWDRRRSRVVPAELLELRTPGGIDLRLVAGR
ncbi:MAG: putative baseplate assembly protein [bacterium]|nr:putative baseplate assembly protein [bacterium]